MYIIDTNIFIRLVAQDDKQAARDCTLLLRAVSQGKLKSMIAREVLAEFIWVLRSHYHLPKAEVAQAAQGILDLNGLTVSTGDNYPLALDLFREYNIKYIDCCIASLPGVLEGKHTIVSYDKEFDRLGVKRMEPGTIVAEL